LLFSLPTFDLAEVGIAAAAIQELAGRESRLAEDRWQAHFDTDDVLIFYCRECAEREFSER
jgi:hypothetical protein